VGYLFSLIYSSIIQGKQSCELKKVNVRHTASIPTDIAFEQTLVTAFA